MKHKRTLIFLLLFPVLFGICYCAAPALPIHNDYETTAVSTLMTDSAAVSPTPTAAPATATPVPFEEYDITLLALGDNLIHMGIVYTGKQDDGTYDYSCLFRGMEELLSAADISVINQETILGGNEKGFSGFPAFNSPTQVGDAIADAGFDVVLHATNHAADQGIDGMLSCISFWEREHPEILMCGIRAETDSSPISFLEVGGLRFAILNYTYGPNMETLPSSIRGHLNMLCAYNEENGRIDFTTLHPNVTEDIKTASAQADVVIVFPHWGTEYQQTPSSYQKQFAAEMTEAGADLIIGTHPHVPQPVEWVTAENGNRALCYYSLGNYVSTQKNALSMLEELAWVTFRVREDGIRIEESTTGVVPLVCHYKSNPVRLQQVYLLEDYTEELAAAHGIRQYGGVTLRLDELKGWAQDIFGNWILEKSDILGSADTPSLTPLP